MTGLAIPDSSAYLWTLGLIFLFGALMACAGVAWPRLFGQQDPAQPDMPGQILTSLDGHNDRLVDVGLMTELHIPRQRTEQP